MEASLQPAAHIFQQCRHDQYTGNCNSILHASTSSKDQWYKKTVPRICHDNFCDRVIILCCGQLQSSNRIAIEATREQSADSKGTRVLYQTDERIAKKERVANFERKEERANERDEDVPARCNVEKTTQRPWHRTCNHRRSSTGIREERQDGKQYQ